MLHKFGLWGVTPSMDSSSWPTFRPSPSRRPMPSLTFVTKRRAPDHIRYWNPKSGEEGRCGGRNVVCESLPSARLPLQLAASASFNELACAILTLAFAIAHIPVHSVEFRTIMVFIQIAFDTLSRMPSARSRSSLRSLRPGLSRRGGLLRFQKRERQHHYHYREKHSISPRHRSRLREATGARQIPH